MTTKERDAMVAKIAALAKDVSFGANTIVDTKKTIISVSPCIDELLGGGIVSGSLGIITGPPKVGKTTTCLHFAKKAQEAGYKIVYLNVEARLTERDLKTIAGLKLDIENFEVISHTEGNILSGETFLAIGELKLNTQKNVVLIVDSFSQLISQSDIESDLRDRTRDSMPLTLSRFCKRIVPSLVLNDSICIGITHTIANQGMGYAPKVEASGNKIQYANNFKLNAKWASDWKIDDVQIGQDIHWDCENSCLGPPGRTGIGKLRYGIGLDEVAEFIPSAINAGLLIKKGGGNFELGDRKIKGEGNLVNLLREDAALFNQLVQETKSRLE